MIGRDDQSEEVSYKVADRRKFNSDGTVREGVVIEESKPTPAVEPEAQAHSLTEVELQDATLAEGFDTGDGEVGQDDDIPGADDPASFINFLSTLATNAAAALGAVPHPATGQRSIDLETGKYWLDVLGMLKERTKGNLHVQEGRLLEGLLADLRLQYVTVVRATEEKLKSQAAQKFSGADILGKK